MFNLKKSQTVINEKMLRQDTLGPTGNDGQKIVDKVLPHRSGTEEHITEHQMQEARTKDMEYHNIEKLLSESKHYFDDKGPNLVIPPINVLVEAIRKDRLSDWKEKKESHWSVEDKNDNAQLGDLPKFPEMKTQHSSILNNSNERFDGLELKEHRKDFLDQKNIKPLIGNITTADIDKVAINIKKGMSLDYDSAIVAILRQASTEKRDLTEVERKTISNLKIDRTKAMLKC